MEIDAVQSTIWRYMDLPKFVSMLASRQLWFCKATGLLDEDPYEGFCRATYSEVTGPATDDQRIVKLTRTDGSASMITPAEMFAGLTNHAVSQCDNAREHLYVNSWCLDDDESMAMWQIYGDVGRGVAIKSSVEQYELAAQMGLPKLHYMFGAVSYHEDLEDCAELQRDFSDGIPMGQYLFPHVLKVGFHKRACFKHENEWRAAVYQEKRAIPGIVVDFDLNRLISEIRVGPRAEEFVVESVRALVEKFGVNKPVERSTLLTPPLRAAVPNLF